jgi:hypothetical protein
MAVNAGFLGQAFYLLTSFEEIHLFINSARFNFASQMPLSSSLLPQQKRDGLYFTDEEFEVGVNRFTVVARLIGDAQSYR